MIPIFNKYNRYIGRKIYRTARKLGIKQIYSIYLSQLPFYLLISAFSIPSGDYVFIGFYITLLPAFSSHIILLLNKSSKFTRNYKTAFKHQAVIYVDRVTKLVNDSHMSPDEKIEYHYYKNSIINLKDEI